LLIRDKVPTSRSVLTWRWSKGPTTPIADFGDPVGSDDYALCLYDNGTLLASAAADHGGTCSGKPCWKEHSTYTTYDNRHASTTGTRSVKLTQGLVDGEASIVFKGKGVKLALPDLGSLSGPVVAQLQRSGGGPCFGATFSAPFTQSDGAVFRDTSD
jgi:hypothetical protein